MSIADNSSDLRTYASEPGANKNVLRLVCSINEELLMQVIAALKPFDSATKILSTDISASIHLVVPTKRQLQQHLTLVAFRQWDYWTAKEPSAQSAGEVFPRPWAALRCYSAGSTSERAAWSDASQMSGIGYCFASTNDETISQMRYYNSGIYKFIFYMWQYT